MKIHRPKTNIPFSFLPARNFPDPTAFSIISTIAALALVARLGPFDHEAGCPGRPPANHPDLSVLEFKERRDPQHNPVLVDSYILRLRRRRAVLYSDALFSVSADSGSPLDRA